MITRESMSDNIDDMIKQAEDIIYWLKKDKEMLKDIPDDLEHKFFSDLNSKMFVYSLIKGDTIEILYRRRYKYQKKAVPPDSLD